MDILGYTEHLSPLLSLLMDILGYTEHLTPLLSLVMNVLGYTEHLSPPLSLLMDALSSLHHTLLTLLPPQSLGDFKSHRVHWTWLYLKPPVLALLMRNIPLRSLGSQ